MGRDVGVQAPWFFYVKWVPAFGMDNTIYLCIIYGSCNGLGMVLMLRIDLDSNGDVWGEHCNM